MAVRLACPLHLMGAERRTSLLPGRSPAQRLDQATRSFSVGYVRRILSYLRTIDPGELNGHVSEGSKGRSTEGPVLHEVIYPMIYWPIGIAVGSWLFFEIARRM